MIKDPQVCTVGRRRITWLCNIMIRFYILVNVFDSFFYVNFFLYLSLPQHRRVMFISSGFMCLLDLPIQMIWRSVYIDLWFFLSEAFLEKPPLSGCWTLQEQGVVQCVQDDFQRPVSFVGFTWALLFTMTTLVTVQLMCMDINKGIILLFFLSQGSGESCVSESPWEEVVLSWEHTVNRLTSSYYSCYLTFGSTAFIIRYIQSVYCL